MQKYPFISIIMPVRNEEQYIGVCLGAVLGQDYPASRIEVFVADGMSTDRTREIVRSFQEQHPNIHLVDNPERIVPTGLNKALSLAKGDVVVRMDGHAVFAPDFLTENVKILSEHPEAWSVGGPIVHTAHTPFGRAVAAAMSHPFGVGNASHRFEDYEGYAEGAAFPALRRWIFEKIGTFDEQLVRNQDDEFNFRIAQAGGKIFISPRVRYQYYVREQPSQLFQQYFQYGYWRIPVMRKHKRPTTLRQILPPAFFAIMFALFGAGLAAGDAVLAFGLPVVYLCILLIGGLMLLPKVGVRIAIMAPLAFGIMHLAYGVGVLFGFWSWLFRPGAWSNTNRMSQISR